MIYKHMSQNVIQIQCDEQIHCFVFSLNRSRVKMVDSSRHTRYNALCIKTCVAVETIYLLSMVKDINSHGHNLCNL